MKPKYVLGVSELRVEGKGEEVRLEVRVSIR